MKMSAITATPSAPAAITEAALAWSMPAMPQHGQAGPPRRARAIRRGEPARADRRLGIGLAAGGEHRADARHSRRSAASSPSASAAWCTVAPTMAAGPEQPARVVRTPCRPARDARPSAPTARATSTRSLISSGTPNGASAARTARAASSDEAGPRRACRAAGTGSPRRAPRRPPARPARGPGSAPDPAPHRRADRGPASCDEPAREQGGLVQPVERIQQLDGEAARPARALGGDARRRRP